MTTPCAHILHPLMVPREGTDQPGRSGAFLAPGAVPVEERGVAEWLVYAQKLSEYLRYYGPDNQFHNQNWKAFLEGDVSAILALAAVQDVEVYKNQINTLLNVGIRRELGQNPVDEGKVKQAFSQLFSLVGTAAWSLDQLWRRLPNTVPLKGTLQNLIQSKLAWELHKLKAFYGAASAELIDESVPLQGSVLGEPVAEASEIFLRQFATHWAATGPVDTQIFGPDPTAEAVRKIYFAVNHSFFASVFDQLLRALARVVADARQQLTQTLTSHDDHTPHMALLLAFLQLLLHNRDHLNTLSARHLDFYYLDVLRLTKKPAVPSQAHVVVELARHVPHEILPQGALFHGGKDSLGQDVLFSLNEVFVPNQAKLIAFKSMYRSTAEDVTRKAAGVNLQSNWLFASPAADSLDGTGAEPVPPEQGWHPFASKHFQHGQLTKLAMPEAVVGFAVASPLLYLTEGTRTITLRFHLTGTTLAPADYADHITATITTAEGWHPLTLLAPRFSLEDSSSGKSLVLKTLLQPDEPATAPFDPAAHLAAFATTHPVLQIHLRHQAGSSYLYEQMKEATLTKVDIAVEGQNLRNLQLYNDFGAIDPAQPFMPFGALPQKDSSLIIGHPDVFQKKEATITGLHITWKDKPAWISSKSVDVESLQQGQWQTKTSGANLFAPPAIALSANDYVTPRYGVRPPYTAATVKGFVRLQLTADFGHKQYQRDLVDYLIARAGEAAGTSSASTTVQALSMVRLLDVGDAVSGVGNILTSLSSGSAAPTEPYTPVIQEISLSYAATATLNLTTATGFDDRQEQFFHVYPFGQKEEHPALKRTDLGDSANLMLVPRFRRKNLGDVFFELKEEDNTVPGWLEHEAEFYVGVQGATPPQTLSVLFQVVEGSANPLVLKPEHHVHWSYLVGNRWTPFAKEQVSDHTGQLTRSGLIRFQLPKAADLLHTLLPTGFIWLRAAVHTASEAVCRLVAVVPQAALATFQDQNNAADFLAQPLPAGSITKLLEPLASVKKVAQPFASFGGALAETPPSFYRRVSERLRHKDRAIAVWDYERLVLEAFPRIYKVKCLPHTRYEPSGTTGMYNEQAPGHVTVVTIPDLRYRNAVDPLQPYTSVGQLEAIKDFLRKRLSCFVTLHVRNPVFEQVRVEFEVKFFPQFDVSAHTLKLKQEITRFLSPWAYGEGQDIRFGGKMYKSTLIDFVEERPYVDFLTNFRLYHLPGQGQPEREADEITATKACSVLVSVPEMRHEITPLETEVEAEAREKCGCG